MSTARATAPTVRTGPFTKAVLSKARKVVNDCVITIVPGEGGYFGTTERHPAVGGKGRTQAECLEKTIEISIIAEATLIEQEQSRDAPQ